MGNKSIEKAIKFIEKDKDLVYLKSIKTTGLAEGFCDYSIKYLVAPKNKIILNIVELDDFCKKIVDLIYGVNTLNKDQHSLGYPWQTHFSDTNGTLYLPYLWLREDIKHPILKGDLTFRAVFFPNEYLMNRSSKENFSSHLDVAEAMVFFNKY